MDMKKIIRIIILLFLIIGLLIPLILSNASMSIGCTERGCPCTQVTEYTEISCNSCFNNQFYFFTGLINIEKVCSSKEIWICENSNLIGQKYADDECEIRIRSYINELFRNPSDAVSIAPLQSP